MSSLNDLIKQSNDIYNKFSSGFIPIYVNGTPINIKLEEKQDCEGRIWIDMTFNKDV